MLTRTTLVCFMLVALAAFASAQQKDDTTALRAFAQWLGENKVQSNVNLGLFENSRFGGVAGKDLTAEDFIVKVPKSIIIDTEVAVSQGPLPAYKEWTLNQEPFMLFVLYHKNAQTFWKPYVDILPTDFSRHPLNWSEEDLALLQSSPVRSQIPQLKQLLAQAHQRLVQGIASSNVFPEGYLTLERYMWAYLATSTRMWTTSSGMVMVPLADMLNHDPNAATGELTQDGSFFVINSTRAYQKGEQVYDSYGPKSNADLLKIYGFCLDENPSDYMTLHFELKTTNIVESIVEPVLRKADPRYTEVGIAKNKRPDRLLRAYRLSLLEFKELEHLNEAINGHPVSLSNELKTYRNVISGLQKLLQSYGSTAEEDAKLQEDPSLSANARNALCLRKNEKEILSNNILVIAKLWENILLEGQLPTGVPVR